MKLNLCVVCGVAAGTPKGLAQVQMHQYPLISSDRMTAVNYSDGEITLCTDCKEAIPLNIMALFDHPNGSKSNSDRDAHGHTVKIFTELFIRDVWSGVKTPTYQDLADAFNRANIRAFNGGNWEYHNMMQTLTRLHIDRNKLMRDKFNIVAPQSIEDIQAAVEATRTLTPEELISSISDPMDEFMQQELAKVTSNKYVEETFVDKTPINKIPTDEELGRMPAEMPGSK